MILIRATTVLSQGWKNNISIKKNTVICSKNYRVFLEKQYHIRRIYFSYIINAFDTLHFYVSYQRYLTPKLYMEQF